MAKRLVTACAVLGVVTAAIVVPIREAEGAVRPTGLVASLTSADCVREKGEVGKKVFRKRHGPRRAMRKCTFRRAPEARRAIAVATAACQAELEDWGVEDFLLDWESFAECVEVYADWEMDGGLEDDPDSDTDAGEE